MTVQLLGFSQAQPLETLAQAFLQYGATGPATLAFDAYDEFLSLLDDQNKRAGLKSLKATDALSDAAFLEAKRAA